MIVIDLSKPRTLVNHLGIMMSTTLSAAVCVAWQAAEAKRKQEEALKLLRKEIDKVAIREQQLQEAAQNVGGCVLFLLCLV